MTFTRFIILCVLILFLSIEQTFADTFKVVQSDFFWSSPNLIKADPIERKDEKAGRKKPSVPLGTMSYQNHFELYGTPPPLDFLLPLKKGPSPLADIKNGHILFRKTGKKLPLNSSAVPSWANSVSPYPVPIPGIDRVLVIYPYYVYRNKENRYMAELYSIQGALLSTFDNLPTHVSLDNPSLLVSPERSGCGEFFKWSIRFYKLRDGSVSEYSCPEGFCGDLLFIKLGKNGPFFIALEMVARTSEIGASMQTNFFVVDHEGTLSASGKTLYAVRQPNLDRRRVGSLSPYAISNLISIDRTDGKDSWIIRFGNGDQRYALKLISTHSDPTPSVIYLLPKDPSLYQKKGYVTMEGKALGPLPLLVIAEPGPYRFSTYYEEERKEKVLTKDILSDQINIVMFQ